MFSRKSKIIQENVVSEISSEHTVQKPFAEEINVIVSI